MIEERSCRVCGSPLETILDLGMLHLSTFLRPGEQPSPTAPLDLCVCSACRLIQLRHTVEPDLLFRKYWYKSGINESMRAELADIVVRAQERVDLARSDYVLDIGANDGTLLSKYPAGVTRIGFEPATNLNAELHEQADLVVADYFPRGLAQLPALSGLVKVITSIAMFYDVDDPITFVEEIRRILHPDGVWIVQFQDWHQMQKATAFDNICHEHLVYYSLASLQRLVEPYGLRVCDAETRTINGGSYRLYVRHAHHPVRPNVTYLWQWELGCEEWSTFNHFAWRCQEARRQIIAAVNQLRHAGKIIDVYGASTKFNTLAQWCRLGWPMLRQAIERSPEKFGLRTVGTNIPIVEEAVGREDPADAWLVGIWQFRDHILRREAAYLRDGGSLVFPLPHVDIVEGRNA